MSVGIAPSVLAADFARLGQAVDDAEAGGASYIHVDVMDGHFVPNLTMGTPVVASLKRVSRLPLDVHLMIEQPDRYIEIFVRAGAAIVDVHAEVVRDLHATIAAIHRLGAKAGVAINPETPVSVITGVAAAVDHVLIMSVHPGFTGQSFLPESLERIAEARALLDAAGSKAAIAVDGGVDQSNAAAIVQAGATILIAGASVYHTPDPAAAVRALRRSAEPRV